MLELYSLCFIFNEAKDLVWLIEKKRPQWQAGFLNGIGGKYENDENSLKCSTREVKEETGLNIDIDQWIPVGEYASSDYVVFINTVSINDNEFAKAEQLTDEKIFTMCVSDVLDINKPILPSTRTAIIASLQKMNDPTMEYLQVRYK